MYRAVVGRFGGETARPVAFQVPSRNTSVAECHRLPWAIEAELADGIERSHAANVPQYISNLLIR